LEVLLLEKREYRSILDEATRRRWIDARVEGEIGGGEGGGCGGREVG
jgi:hypothetical protein